MSKVNKTLPPLGEIHISTTGSDGFWIDEMYLYKKRESEFVRTTCSQGICTSQTIKKNQDPILVQQWGRDGGKGYCLSLDRDDAKGSWKHYVDQQTQCVKTMRFTVADGKAYAVAYGSKKLVDYKVDIYTGTSSGAGTDSNIFITIYGDKGNTGEIKLNPLISGNAFENGDKDSVILKGREDIGSVKKVKLRSDGWYAGSDWQMDKVVVTVNGTKKTLNCENLWIDGNSRTCPPSN
ncbi:hypothetical protein IFHNHDMJ_00603 [Synechococcus sp. CBW1107]|nr:hypothetical protein IFHNHDMJ_00603 [Synechococcus sp. CBW1107]